MKVTYSIASSLLAVALTTSCTSIPKAMTDRVPASAQPADESTVLGRQMLQPPTAAEGKSGFLAVDRGWDALLWRCAMAAQAEKTIEIQYYIWNPDEAGLIFADHLLKAADRGVKIRCLLDDLAVRAGSKRLASLNAHPNIEIRVYNPVGRAYEDMTARGLQLAKDPARTNRRMHNKLFVVDGGVAITGGRNIGNEYFDLSSEMNFRDRDVLTVGPTVPALAATFDTYWNSPWVVEMDRVAGQMTSSNWVTRYYHSIQERAAGAMNKLPGFREGAATMSARLTNLWSEVHLGQGHVVCDEPGKNILHGSMTGFGASGELLTEAALGIQKELIVQSAYSLAMDGTLDLLRQLKKRGAKVRLITNSSASIDEPFVFAKYKSQRPLLMDLGVEIFEIRPDGKAWEKRVATHPTPRNPTPVGLHVKNLVFDASRIYIGSFNLDPRSTHLNTELGLLIDCPPLAQEVRSIMVEECETSTSWQVLRSNEGVMTWLGRDDGTPRIWTREPGLSWSRRIKLFFVGLLPVDDLL
jgi:putative cardiolipin synthase